ncbi:sensor histidine kinase [Mucilaginibacter gotjawali]|uniref:Signal transduction histidine kinase n=2 Tax=Mucilaginibacter gotjawali TaxID=1550579 RepID=A0A839SE84_9SPHI|nr:HAMP domain-containing sensor histidine kinase [Mucilaginibacter gotjawali]MBB3056096.1 signal transduction histidine kinase [Mucilaginibacter gotjawali]BAU53567.1 Sensor histidine kinase RcsC [Mucilaginibacter gotjawali]
MKQSFWSKIIGTPVDFSLEARIFNAITFVSTVTLILTLALNYILGIEQLAVLMLFVFFIAGVCYYYSRVKLKLNASVIVYMTVINILLIVNFKYNSGINGPTLLIFMLSFFLTISIVPRKQYWFWITLNVVIVGMLLLIEYLQPQLISYTYADKQSRFIDFSYTYVSIVLFMFFVTTTVRKSYFAEKKLVEEKAAELAAANDTKDKLFSILAHDLRSPLSSIQNYLEILSEFKLEESEKESIKKDLLKSTIYTQQMLSNLLSWSKTQMHGVKVNGVKVNVKDVLKSTFQIHQTIAAEKGIHLANQLKPDVYIIADTDMLQLVVRNLISNAIKFTSPGGEIIILSDVVDDECRIMVKDNGIGIPFEEQANIFSLKVNSVYGTKNEKGIGLGLVLCKEFTELQNGKIGFESDPGVGSVFYISFKLYRDNNGNDIQGDGRLIKKEVGS